MDAAKFEVLSMGSAGSWLATNQFRGRGRWFSISIPPYVEALAITFKEFFETAP